MTKLERKVVTSFGKTFFVDENMVMVGLKEKDGSEVPFESFKSNDVRT